MHAGIEPKAQSLFVFTGPCEYSVENRAVMSALRQLLDIRLREVLREDKSGTYGAGVGAGCSHIPYPHYQVTVSFGSAPERTDELSKALFGVIDSIKAGAGQRLQHDEDPRARPPRARDGAASRTTAG